MIFNLHIGVCVLILTCLSAGQTQKPNIVLIIADDLGWDDVGFHGSEIKTPNIDKLAYDGVILNNYYVSPICTPTRGSLMTGRHPIHLGLQHYVIAAPEPWGLPLNHTTMAQHLKHLGYSTHIVGKWHLGFFKNEYLPTSRGFDSHFGYWTGRDDYYSHIDIDEEYLPTSRGFDSHFGYWNGKEDYNNHYEITSGYKGLDYRNNMEVVNRTSYSTEDYTSEAVNVINKHNKSEPLFLYLAHQAVHAGNGNAPLQAPDEYVNRFPYIDNTRRRTFAGMVAALDDSVGEVVRTLNHHNMMDNTIIVFSTDNGGPANNYDSNSACNYPLRGTKNTLWEGGVHGVGFVHSRLLKKRHVKSDNMVHVSDWLPTLYSAAGGDVSDLGQIDGTDMWDMIQNDGPAIRTEILHNIDPYSKFSAIRVGDYKLIQGDISGGRNDHWYPCSFPFQPENQDEIYSNYGNEYWYKSDNNKPTLNQLDDSDGRGVYNTTVRELYEKEISYRPKQRDTYTQHVPNTPYNIACGDPPANYTTNCIPKQSACLFHIPTDPCEYNNIADAYPAIVENLQARIIEYASGAVKPVNKPMDKMANPDLYGGIWVPWQGSDL